MPFPAIRHCLICEDLRQEVGGKSSILGFYGAAPHVAIIVGNFNRPIQQLMFVLLAAPTAEASSHEVSLRILSPKGELVGEERPPKSLTLEKPAGQTQLLLAFGVRNMTFTEAGDHSFVLLVDGREHFRATFGIREADQNASPSV